MILELDDEERGLLILAAATGGATAAGEEMSDEALGELRADLEKLRALLTRIL